MDDARWTDGWTSWWRPLGAALPLCLAVAPLAAQFAGRVSGRLEGWIGPANGYNSRAVADLGGTWRYGRFEVDGFYGFRYWTSADAISPLNAEAGRSLERVQGVVATYRIGACRVGAWTGRRAILTLGVSEVWGQTIGYYDGVAPLAKCTAGPFSLEAHGPLLRYQPLTLPWPLYEMTARVEHGLLRVELYGTLGGPQPPVLDLRIEAGKTLRAGMYAGWIAAPVPGVRVSRFALALSAGP